MKRTVFVSIAVLVCAGMAWAQGREPASKDQPPESIDASGKVTTETLSTTAYKGAVDRLLCPDRVLDISCCTTGDGPALVVFEPNPAARVTGIAYILSASGPASLAIYNSRGRKVKTLFVCQGKAGKYRIDWDGRSEKGGVLPCGDYYCRLACGGAIEVRKFAVSK